MEDEAPAQELIGKTLGGRFRLTAFLGEGAMASVYRGEQDADPRDVAVKIMHPFLLRDATFAKRFTREAKAAARIEHRNSVRILEHGEDGELLYLAMELLRGQDLFDVLARDRRLPEARAARIVAQICGALECAHAQGIVHRDLKPENVMILADPENPGADLVKVLDFGIAKIMERDRRGDTEEPKSGPISSLPPSSVLTMVGSLVGTPEYMSPEQSVGQPVDARSDVYACGVLLFQCVTGRVPFAGKSPVDIMMQHTDKPPPAPSSIVPAIHPGLEKTILRALGKLPEHRQQSARELADELTALLPELGHASKRTHAVSGSIPPPGKSLPGLPATVVITGRDSEPPETLRSPDTGEEELVATLRKTPAAPPAVEPAPPPATRSTTAISPGADRRTPAPERKLAADIRGTLRSAEEEEAVPSVPIHELSNSTREMLKAQREAARQREAEPAPLVPAESAHPAPPPPEKQVPPLVPTIIRRLGAAPGQAGLRPQTPDRSLLSWWAFAVIAAMLVGLIWLVRYLRFG